ncbi:MAG: ABC transporter permease [Rhodospirillaceae bacterium]|jgi:peptide/nickel transport system permease protein|nr:ABC transporter permease [Rhodospirillaceae bacterium]MBT6304902.1 ABC transporter permease [Rhodospirillaceae bacterium]MDG1274290.1 ABC transporter permease [Alphaproteobacteria bacterium]
MATSEIPSEEFILPKKKTILDGILRMLRKQPLGSAGFIVIIIMAFGALFADQVAPYDPEMENFEYMLSPPGTVDATTGQTFHFGTDSFGRDQLSRMIYGARTALLVGFTASFVGAFIGLVLGVGSAYFGGYVDLIFQRVMDIFMAFPLVIMALAIVSIFGTGLENVIIAITIPFIPRCARVVRSSALALRELPYIDAARSVGYSHSRIILRHMVPNVMAPFLIMLTAFVGQAILTEASLSYLGMGVQEPTAAWGLMLQGGAEEYAESAPWVPIWPGVAITLAVFGFNLFGDAVRDVMDPKLRSQT